MPYPPRYRAEVYWLPRPGGGGAGSLRRGCADWRALGAHGRCAPPPGSPLPQRTPGGPSLSDSTLIAQGQCSFHHCLRSTKHLRPGPGVFLVWLALVVGAADGVGAQEGEGGVEQGSFESLAAGVETCSPRMLARMEVPDPLVTGDGPGAGGRVGGGGGPALCLGQEDGGGRGPGAGRGWWRPGEGGSARQGAGPGRGARPAGRTGRRAGWAGRRRRSVPVRAAVCFSGASQACWAQALWRRSCSLSPAAIPVGPAVLRLAGAAPGGDDLRDRVAPRVRPSGPSPGPGAGPACAQAPDAVSMLGAAVSSSELVTALRAWGAVLAAWAVTAASRAPVPAPPERQVGDAAHRRTPPGSPPSAPCPRSLSRPRGPDGGGPAHGPPTR